MTGEECREARERLNWTRAELSTKSTPDFLVAYEYELRAALEAAGAEFGKA